MRLSTRLTVAMVGLVMLTATAVGVLSHLNIARQALPRALDRIDANARVLGLQLESAVRGAVADVSVQGGAVAGLIRATATGADPVDGTPAAVWRQRLACARSATPNRARSAQFTTRACGAEPVQDARGGDAAYAALSAAATAFASACLR